MPNYNQVTFAGHLGRDAELRRTQTGKAVINLPIAATHRSKHADGAMKEHTTWIDAVCWGPVAEGIAPEAKKGVGVLVIGRLDVQTWDDKKTGEKRSKHVIVADVATVLPSRAGAEGPDAEPVPF